MCCISSFIVVLHSILSVQSTRYYVNPSNSAPITNGLSWSTAFTELSSALQTSSANDVIWLKGQETYVPDIGTTDRTDCFLVNEGVQIYGGFAGSESFLSQRPSTIEQYESIISGNLFQNADNCYHVLTFTESISLHRVTIANGNADFEYDTWETRPLLHGFGGGLIAADNTLTQSVILNEVTFRDNVALNGGALWFGGSSFTQTSVQITDCVFVNNTAKNGLYEGGYGAAIYAYDAVNIDIEGAKFTGNTAEFRGGGIYIDYGAEFKCDTCVFMENTARGFGGGIFAENRRNPQGTKPNIVSSEFISNNVTIYGGAICNFNGIEMTSFSNLFQSNLANIGGGNARVIKSNITSSINNINDGNIARQLSSTNDLYLEAEILFTSADSSIDYDALEIIDHLWEQYESKQDQIDLRSFDINDDLCYVNGANTNLIRNGLSWSTAHIDIQDCLDQLQSNQNGAEIWVAQGTYYPAIIPSYKLSLGLNRIIDYSFEMYTNIRMYGGFKGDESTRDERDFSEYRVVLSGNIGLNFQVINLLIAAPNVLIDGFIFQDAGCSDLSAKYSGGGIVANGVRFDLVNSVFYKLCSNENGGALYMKDINGDIIIKNTAFLANTASFNGGAIYMESNTYLYTEWIHFIHNRASRIGGAVFLTEHSYAAFEPAEFMYNYAHIAGGCVGIEERSNATFDCGNFYNNSARWEGGCLYNGKGTDLLTAPLQQWFKVLGTTGLFVGNHLINEGVYDRGQSDLYLWPYTDYIFEKAECGGNKPPHTAPPTSPPSICVPSAVPTCPPTTFIPSTPPSICVPTNIPTCDPTPEPTANSIICGAEPYIDTYSGEQIVFEFELDEIYSQYTVAIDTCSSTFDTYLFLYDYSPMTFIDSCDDCGNFNSLGDCSSTAGGILDICCSPNGELQSKLEVDLAAGSYQLILAHSPKSGAVEEGTYILNIICTPRGVQPTDEPTEPPIVEYIVCNPNEPYTGSYNGETLSFQLINDKDQNVIINTCWSDFDTFVMLYDHNPSTQLLGSCDDCGDGINSIGDCSSSGNDFLDICCLPGGSLQSQIRTDLDAGIYELIVRHAPKAGVFVSGTFVLDIICSPIEIEPTPAPNMPTAYWPTRKYRNRWPTPYPRNIPDECENRCDAYRVSVDDWYRNEDEICIVYNVQRLLDSGYFCYQDIRYLVLGLCADVDCSVQDLNGLIRSYRELSDRRRRSLLGSYSSNVYGVESGDLYGIRINLPVSNELVFELCLVDVFLDDLDFSNVIQFKRGYTTFTCSEAWLVGLPCLDADKFEQGAYSDTGYNLEGKRYKTYYKRKRNRNQRNKRYRAENDADTLDFTQLSTESVVKWEVLTVIILLCLCCCGIIIYCVVLRKKRKKVKLEQNKIKSHDNDSDSDKQCDNDHFGRTATAKTRFKRNNKQTYSGVEMEEVDESCDSQDSQCECFNLYYYLYNMYVLLFSLFQFIIIIIIIIHYCFILYF